MHKKVMEKVVAKVIRETCHKEREENRLENLQLISLQMNEHLNMQLLEVEEQILNIIGL